MPSLADIPEQFLQRDQYGPFLTWLLQYPCGWNATRATILLWSRATNRKITARDWAAIEDRWIHRNAR